MKPLKATDLRAASVDELRAKERELAEQLFNLRIQKAIGQLEKPSRLREIRRDLARVMTVLGEKSA
jgi:large subunit ribosomal protein L29